MADKPISGLTKATQILDEDMFVLEQNGVPKNLTGRILAAWLLKVANSHGGIQMLEKMGTSGLTDTYRITLVDGTTFDFPVTNGRQVTKVAKTGTNILVDTYTMTYNDGTTSTFKVTNGRGISGITKTGTNGLTDTYTITFNDNTKETFTVQNGRGISSIAKTSASGLVDTYTVKYNDGGTDTIQVTNGAKGEPGDPWYVWIKYASQMPTEDSNSFGDIIDDYMGVYSGRADTAPTDWKEYQWKKIRGKTGLTPQFTIGTVETVDADEDADVTITGTSENPVLNFAIPRARDGEDGEDGKTPKFSIGTVTTLPWYAEAKATISGLPEAPVLNLSIPSGKDGTNGSGTANWNINELGEPGFIRNRTHYIRVEKKILLDTTAGLDAEGNGAVALEIDAADHKLFEITWQTVPYICTMRDVTYLEAGDETVFAVGNLNKYHSSFMDTGEPFLIKYFPAQTRVEISSSAEYASLYVALQIAYAEDVEKLNDKFLDATWLAKKKVSGIDGVILPETTVEFSGGPEPVDGILSGVFQVGWDYIVNWNGKDYLATCFMDDGAYQLGNGALSGSTITSDDPFCIANFGGTGFTVWAGPDEPNTVTLSIIGKKKVAYNQIPKEHLPEDVGGVNVTGATPGQLIIVKSVDENGKPTEWEAVDRTHWAEGGMEEITFDGDLTGKTYIDVQGNGSMYVVFVSEKILTKEDLIGKPIVAMMGGQEMSEIVTEEGFADLSALGFSGANGFARMYGDMPIAFFVQESAEGFSAGTYFILYMNSGVPYAYVKSLHYDGEIVHKLDNKYLDLNWLPTKKTERTEVLPETSITGANMDIPGITVADCPAGTIFVVTVNGTEYKCASFAPEMETETVFGNLSLVASSLPNTGEPFIGSVTQTTAEIFSPETGGAISVSIEKANYSKIPIEHLLSYTMPTDWGNIGVGAASINASEIAEAEAVIAEGGSVFAKINGLVSPVFGAHEQSGIGTAFAVGDESIYKITTRYGTEFALTRVPVLPNAPDAYEDIKGFAVPNPAKAKVGQVLRVAKLGANSDYSTVPVAYEAVDQWEIVSPNGTKYKIVVADDGTLSTEAVTT